MSQDRLPFGHGIPGRGPDGPDGTKRLESILREGSAAPPSDGFRVAVKQRFLGAQVTKESAESNSYSDALGETLETWQAPGARSEFRARLRDRFLAQAEQDQGTHDQGVGTPPQGAQSEQESPEPLPVREVQARGSAPRKPGTLLSFWAPLAVAAALLLIWIGPKFFAGGDPSSPAPGAGSPIAGSAVLAWSLPDELKGLHWTIDGVEVAPSESAEQIVKRLASARRVAAVDGGKLRLAYGRLFQVQLAEGSELDLSKFREAQSDTEFHLGMIGDAGGFYFQTGPDFDDCELTFQTPEAEIAVVGTVFAVDRYPDGSAMEGTCVCCAEGTVQVRATHERRAAAVAGKSCFVVPGDGELMNSEVVHDHMAPMDDLVAASVPGLWLD